MIRQPISIYNNWSAYDELSDNVELTEELAMEQLDQMLRLREHGVRFDYYLMDAFWFAPDGGYREWRTPHWPNGPVRWLEKCRENGILPGLWFSGNTLCKLDSIPEWDDSLDPRMGGMCMFTGGFLKHFIDSLQYWYDRGVRVYKIDFMRFDASTPHVLKTHLPSETHKLNEDVFGSAFRLFREKNPEVVFLGYNGLGGEQTATAESFEKNVDTRWMEVFDTLYCGDPRPSNVPCMSYWRSMDIYSDHMVRAYEANDIPLERIDNTAFMIGKTGTCCNRRTAAWKGMLILSLARGGWANIYYGNLELLSDDDARWFAKVQSMFMRMQALGRTVTFGGIPGERIPYGFASLGESGALYTLVNPSQSVQTVPIPTFQQYQSPVSKGRILFTDAGFVPQLVDGSITLGPEQMAVVGFGTYASDEYDLGIQEDVVIPKSIQTIEARFAPDGENAASASFPAPDAGLRIVMRHLDDAGRPVRISGGAPPDGTTMGKIYRISIRQREHEIPVHVNYDKATWAGLSWAVGEVEQSDLTPGEQIIVRCEVQAGRGPRLECEVYQVHY